MASCEFCVVGGKSGGFLFPSLKRWHHTGHVKQGTKVEMYNVRSTKDFIQYVEMTPYETP